MGGLFTFFKFIAKTIYVTFNLNLNKIKIIDLFLDLNSDNNKKINFSNEIFNKSLIKSN